MRYSVNVSCGLAVTRYLKVRLAPETTTASAATLGCHGNYGKSRTHGEPERLRRLLMPAQALRSGMTSNHEPPNTYGAVLSVIGSLAGALVFLMLVGVAAWIVISSGTGHPPWQ